MYGKERRKYNFNTSHVTVYPYRLKGFQLTSEFQYISCYGLSVDFRLEIMAGNVFQYISCYGLSFRFSYKYTIYHHFNTSHVTVYLGTLIRSRSHKKISIHLMLRFIRELPGIATTFLRISIHLMLRFIVR